MSVYRVLDYRAFSVFRICVCQSKQILDKTKPRTFKKKTQEALDSLKALT